MMFRLNIDKFSKKVPIPVFERILKNNVGMTDEELLIIGDRGFAPTNLLSPVLTNAYAVAANNLGISNRTVFQNTKARGEEGDYVMLQVLKKLPPASVVVVNVSNRMGRMGLLGSTFRKFCEKKNHRFISTASLGDLPNSSLSKVVDALDVDVLSLEKKANRIKNMIDNGTEINITTKKGTDLTIGVQTRKALTATGIYLEKATGGNAIPAETYVAPDKKSVNGTVVIDGSIRTNNHSYLVRQPVVIDVERSDIIKWNNVPESKLLQQSIREAYLKSKYPWGLKRIGEVGIGLNPRAKLIGSTMIDEKARNTAHVAIGSNKWFGGDVSAIIHLDQVFKNPLIKVDSRILKL